MSKAKARRLVEAQSEAAQPTTTEIPAELGVGSSGGDEVLRPPKKTARDLVYRFFELSWVERYRITKELGLHSEDDLDVVGVEEQEIMRRWFARARERNQIDELEQLVSNASRPPGGAAQVTTGEVTCCLSDPDLVVHRKHADCPREEPHQWDDCGVVHPIGDGPTEELKKFLLFVASGGYVNPCGDTNCGACTPCRARTTLNRLGESE